MNNEKVKDGFELTRILYIIEAALEYFVSIAVGTVYLAKITAYCGISDEVTAILTAFVSLGCSFQLLSIFFGGKSSVKGFVSGGHIVSQLLFTALYIIPLLGFNDNAKAIILIIALLAAQIIHNLVNAPKNREGFAVTLIDEDDISKSRPVVFADLKTSLFYPFVQIYNDKAYISYTVDRKHIRLSRFTVPQ